MKLDLNSNFKSLLDEKQSLQNTVKALSNEIEQLSMMNERLLCDLQVKDFYLEYSKVMEELTKLKAGHMILINMINEGDVQLMQETKSKPSLSISTHTNVNPLESASKSV